jgi:hypothetical protein
VGAAWARGKEGDVKALIVVLLVVGFVVTYWWWVAAVDRRCGALLWLAFYLAGVVDRRYEDIGGQKQFIGPTQRFLSARRNDAER